MIAPTVNLAAAVSTTPAASGGALISAASGQQGTASARPGGAQDGSFAAWMHEQGVADRTGKGNSASPRSSAGAADPSNDLVSHDGALSDGAFQSVASAEGVSKSVTAGAAMLSGTSAEVSAKSVRLQVPATFSNAAQEGAASADAQLRSDGPKSQASAGSASLSFKAQPASPEVASNEAAVGAASAGSGAGKSFLLPSSATLNDTAETPVSGKSEAISFLEGSAASIDTSPSTPAVVDAAVPPGSPATTALTDASTVTPASPPLSAAGGVWAGLPTGAGIVDPAPSMDANVGRDTSGNVTGVTAQPVSGLSSVMPAAVPLANVPFAYGTGSTQVPGSKDHSSSMPVASTADLTAARTADTPAVCLPSLPAATLPADAAPAAVLVPAAVPAPKVTATVPQRPLQQAPVPSPTVLSPTVNPGAPRSAGSVPEGGTLSSPAAAETAAVAAPAVAASVPAQAAVSGTAAPSALPDAVVASVPVAVAKDAVQPTNDTSPGGAKAVPARASSAVRPGAHHGVRGAEVTGTQPLVPNAAAQLPVAQLQVQTASGAPPQRMVAPYKDGGAAMSAVSNGSPTGRLDTTTVAGTATPAVVQANAGVAQPGLPDDLRGGAQVGVAGVVSVVGVKDGAGSDDTPDASSGTRGGSDGAVTAHGSTAGLASLQAGSPDATFAYSFQQHGVGEAPRSTSVASPVAGAGQSDAPATTQGTAPLRHLDVSVEDSVLGTVGVRAEMRGGVLHASISGGADVAAALPELHQFLQHNDVGIRTVVEHIAPALRVSDGSSLSSSGNQGSAGGSGSAASFGGSAGGSNGNTPAGGASTNDGSSTGSGAGTREDAPGGDRSVVRSTDALRSYTSSSSQMDGGVTFNRTDQPQGSRLSIHI